MPEESTTPDLVELTRGIIEAANQRDFDAVMSFFAPDSVWDTSPLGIGMFEGPRAIRASFDGWNDAYDEHEVRGLEILALGHGVVYALVREDGRVKGSDQRVEARVAWVG